jgi:hypothetical protein
MSITGGGVNATLLYAIDPLGVDVTLGAQFFGVATPTITIASWNAPAVPAFNLF